MEWVETTGSSVDDAKSRALDTLGVDEMEAEFEILEEPKAGLFGRVRGEARVRARIRPVTPRPKVERRERKRRPRADSSPTKSESGSSSDTRRKEAGGSRKATSGGSSGSRQTKQTTEREQAADKEETMSETTTLEQQGEIVAEFLTGLLDSFDLDGTVDRVSIDDEMLEIQVNGEDLGLLIGPKGQTLSALQELSRTVVQRQSQGSSQGRFRLDVSGYRERRREALQRFTQKVAEDVLESGSARSLEPMGAADRKVVHDTINDIDGVHTISEGDEPSRRVVVLPD